MEFDLTDAELFLCEREAKPGSWAARRIRGESFSPWAPSLSRTPSGQKACMTPLHFFLRAVPMFCLTGVSCAVPLFFPASTTPITSPSHLRLIPKQIHKCLQFGQCFQFSLIFFVTIPGGSLWLGQRLFFIARLPHHLWDFSIAVYVLDSWAAGTKM